jgi:hypothetical protein
MVLRLDPHFVRVHRGVAIDVRSLLLLRVCGRTMRGPLVSYVPGERTDARAAFSYALQHKSRSNQLQDRAMQE